MKKRGKCVSGSRIERERRFQCFTQAQLSERCGLSSRTILRYEAGQVCVSIQNVERLADALNVDAEYLAGWTFIRNENEFLSVYKSYLKKYRKIMEECPEEKPTFNSDLKAFILDYNRFPVGNDEQSFFKRKKVTSNPSIIESRIKEVRFEQRNISNALKNKETDIDGAFNFEDANQSTEKYPRMEWKDLAKNTGISRTSIWRYNKTGKDDTRSSISVATVEKLARELKCDPAYLVGWTDKRVKSNNYKAVLNFFKNNFSKKHMDSWEWIIVFWKDVKVFIDNYQPDRCPEIVKTEIGSTPFSIEETELQK